MVNKEVIEEIREVLENEEFNLSSSINSFFNLLFWKNYSEGYVNIEDKDEIISEIKKNNITNTREILPLVNRIRSQIGLPLLTDKINYTLQEITEEVEKKLVAEEL